MILCQRRGNFPRIVQSTPYVATPVAVNSGAAVEELIATVAHSYTGDSAMDRSGDAGAQFSQAAVSLNAEAIGVEKSMRFCVQSHCNHHSQLESLEGAGIDHQHDRDNDTGQCVSGACCWIPFCLWSAGARRIRLHH